MVKPAASRPDSGFTLLEVLVTVALFMLVMLLLFRGVTAVTATVTMGQRQSDLYRRLRSVRRVMRQDIRSMIVHPDWPVLAETVAGDPPQRVFGFLRYGPGIEGNTETEFVYYQREAHPAVERLEQWVRYSTPATNRQTLTGEWWTALDPGTLDREVLADDLISLDLDCLTDAGRETGSLTNQVQAVDVRLFLTLPPYSDPETVSSSRMQRMWEENGSWMHFRERPGFSRGPEVEESP